MDLSPRAYEKNLVRWGIMSVWTRTSHFGFFAILVLLATTSIGSAQAQVFIFAPGTGIVSSEGVLSFKDIYSFNIPSLYLSGGSVIQLDASTTYPTLLSNQIRFALWGHSPSNIPKVDIVVPIPSTYVLHAKSYIWASSNLFIDGQSSNKTVTVSFEPFGAGIKVVNSSCILTSVTYSSDGGVEILGITTENAGVMKLLSPSGKPTTVVLDGVTQPEGSSWTFNAAANILTLTGSSVWQIYWGGKTSITITSNPNGSTLVRVDGVLITTPKTYEWDVGSTHALEALSPVVGGPATQYVWTGWSDGGAGSHNYVVPLSAETVTATYKTQHYLAVSSNPLTIDNPRPSGWYDEGSTVTVQCDTPVSDGSKKQYVFTSWSVDASGSNPTVMLTMDGPKDVVADYKTRYLLSIAVSSYGSGSTNPAPGTHWYDLGTSVQVTAIPASTYILKNWELDGVDKGATNPISFSMDAPHDLTANFERPTVEVAVTSSIEGSGFAEVDGTPITTPETFQWPYGSSHLLNAKSPVSVADGVRYVWVSWSDGGGQTHTITVPPSPVTFTATYKTQNRLIVSVNDTTKGTTSPSTGIYWYDSGQAVQVTANPNPGYVLDEWMLDGESAGSDNPISVGMVEPHDLLAKFSRPSISVTITSTPEGEGFVLVDGEPAVTPAEFHWVIGGTHTISILTPLSGGNGTQYVWVEWSDGGEQTHNITVSEPVTLTAIYKRQYLLTIQTVERYGSTTPASPGEYWFDENTIIDSRATPRQGYLFIYWMLDGVNVGEDNPISVTMNRIHSLKAVFEYGAETLIVEALQDGGGVVRGLPVTVDGSVTKQTDLNGRVNFTVSKGAHTVQVQSPYNKDVVTRYLFLRWSDGVTENPRMVAAFGSPLRAIFKPQFLVAVETMPVGLTPNPTVTPGGDGGFYDVGSTVTLTAGDVAGFTFNMWVLNGESRPFGEKTSTFSVRNPVVGVAVFTTSGRVIGGRGGVSLPFYDQSIISIFSLLAVAVIGLRRELLFRLRGVRRSS